MRLYLKVFAACAVPFGIVMTVTSVFRFGLSMEAIGRGIAGGVGYGALMSATLVTLHKRVVKPRPGMPEDASKVKHTRKIQLAHSYEEAFGLAVSSLQSLGKHKIQQSEKSSGKIQAKIGLNPKSAGEVISFNVRRISDGQTEIEVTSRPWLPTTLVDYGKNLENVEKIVNFLSSKA